MDFSNKTPILFLLVACANCIAGQRLYAPRNLQVTIMDEEVIVYWDKATDSRSDGHYIVQFGRYGHAGDWTEVEDCSNITNNFCDISDYIEEFDRNYKVRVLLEVGTNRSVWTQKKVLLQYSELQPPSFNMWATSSTLTIHVHQKPVLQKIYPFGVTYTIFLEEKGQNKTTITSLKDDVWDHQSEKTFTSLHWGKEYCVTVKVEGNGGVAKSQSTPQCLVLPEQEWIIIAVASLTVSGFLVVTAVIATFIMCYIKRPVKTPPALKSPATGWRPLSVGDGPIEVVTDKGWFLFKAETEVNRAFKDLPTTHVTDQQIGEEDRRPSTDSGVSVKSQDGMCSNFLMRDEGGDALSTCKTEDSGMGLSCHSDASSLNLEEQDSGCLHKSGEYHSQKLRTVCVHESDNVDVFKEKLPDPQQAGVVSGYMTNNSLCTCSGANLCIWCHNHSHYRGKYKGILQNNNIMESYSSYRSNNQTNNMSQTETNLTLAQMEQTFPMLTSLSSFPLMEKGRDLNMNDVSISLCDVEIHSY